MDILNLESVVRSYYDAFNTRDLEFLKSLCAEGFELRDVACNVSFKGGDGLKHYHQAWIDSFPDGQIEILNLVSGGNRVVAEFRGIGTHQGTFRSPYGSIPTTDKEVSLQVCDVFELKKGKIAKITTYYDLAGFLQQLGKTPLRQAA